MSILKGSLSEDLVNRVNLLVEKHSEEFKKFKSFSSYMSDIENNAFGLAIGSAIVGVTTIATGMIIGGAYFGNGQVGGAIGSIIPVAMAVGSVGLYALHSKLQKDFMANPNIDNEVRSEQAVKRGDKLIKKLENSEFEYATEDVKKVLENHYKYPQNDPTQEIKKAIINSKNKL